MLQLGHGVVDALGPGGHVGHFASRGWWQLITFPVKSTFEQIWDQANHLNLFAVVDPSKKLHDGPTLN